MPALSNPTEPDAPGSQGDLAPVQQNAAPTGVIHDLGYRPYGGPRLGERQVAWSFFLTGLRNTYGLGRSGRSKVLPIGLAGLMLLPALILVGVLVQAREILELDAQIVSYSTFPITTQLLISVFVAAQAPALFSRDLRFRSITLYLARPMRRSNYVLVRLASLAAGTFLLIGAPLTLMYVGGLLADLPLWRETRLFLGGLLGAALLAILLAGLAALVAALTVRRGMAVAAVIVVLLVSYTVVSSIQGIAYGTEHYKVGEVAGLFSPYTLVNGVQHFLFDVASATPTPPQGALMGLLYIAITLLWIAVAVFALNARYRRVNP